LSYHPVYVAELIYPVGNVIFMQVVSSPGFSATG